MIVEELIRELIKIGHPEAEVHFPDTECPPKILKVLGLIYDADKNIIIFKW